MNQVLLDKLPLKYMQRCVGIEFFIFDMASKSDHLDPCSRFVLFRVRELIAAKMIVEKFLPFTFFSSCTAWTEMIGVLTPGNPAFPALPARRVKHLIVEMYVATKKVGRHVYFLFYLSRR